jgi:hypothetical protein
MPDEGVVESNIASIGIAMDVPDVPSASRILISLVSIGLAIVRGRRCIALIRSLSLGHIREGAMVVVVVVVVERKSYENELTRLCGRAFIVILLPRCTQRIQPIR